MNAESPTQPRSLKFLKNYSGFGVGNGVRLGLAGFYWLLLIIHELPPLGMFDWGVETTFVGIMVSLGIVVGTVLENKYSGSRDKEKSGGLNDCIIVVAPSLFVAWSGGIQFSSPTMLVILSLVGISIISASVSVILKRIRSNTICLNNLEVIGGSSSVLLGALVAIVSVDMLLKLPFWLVVLPTCALLLTPIRSLSVNKGDALGLRYAMTETAFEFSGLKLLRLMAGLLLLCAGMGSIATVWIHYLIHILGDRYQLRFAIVVAVICGCVFGKLLAHALVGRAPSKIACVLCALLIFEVWSTMALNILPHCMPFFGSLGAIVGSGGTEVIELALVILLFSGPAISALAVVLVLLAEAGGQVVSHKWQTVAHLSIFVVIVLASVYFGSEVVIPHVGAQFLFSCSLVCVALGVIICCRQWLMDRWALIGGICLAGLPLMFYAKSLNSLLLNSANYRYGENARPVENPRSGFFVTGRAGNWIVSIGPTNSVVSVGGMKCWDSGPRSPAKDGFDRITERAAAEVPQYLRPHSTNTVVLGLGNGVTASAFCESSNTTVLVVEREPAAERVLRYLRRHQTPEGMPHDFKVINRNPIWYVEETDSHPDILVINTPQLWTVNGRAMVSPCTIRAYHGCISPNGLVVLPFNGIYLNPSEMIRLIEAFQEVFRNVGIFLVDEDHGLVIASDGKLDLPDNLSKTQVARSPESLGPEWLPAGVDISLAFACRMVNGTTVTLRLRRAAGLEARISDSVPIDFGTPYLTRQRSRQTLENMMLLNSPISKEFSAAGHITSSNPNTRYLVGEVMRRYRAGNVSLAKELLNAGRFADTNDVCIASARYMLTFNTDIKRMSNVLTALPNYILRHGFASDLQIRGDDILSKRAFALIDTLNFPQEEDRVRDAVLSVAALSQSNSKSSGGVGAVSDHDGKAQPVIEIDNKRER